VAYRILADFVLVGHLAFILYVVLGALLVRWRRRAAIIHLPCVAYGAAIEHWHWVCPLTPLENRLRVLAGETGFAGGFVEHYIAPIVYPLPLPAATWDGLAIAVIAVNGLAYAWAFRRPFPAKGNPKG